MAGKTKVDVSLDFRENKTIHLVSWNAMQRHARKAGDVVFGHAQVEIHSPSMGMEWFIDEDVGTVKVAVKLLIIRIFCKSDIWMFDGIEKTSACFKHVADHEYKHVKLYKRSLTRSVRQIRRAFEREKYPDLKKPLELELREGHAFVQRWVSSLHDLHAQELARAKANAQSLSDKIHTASEKRRTERFCLEFAP